MPDVHGFALAVPKADAAMARLGATLWRRHGAPSDVEGVADDLPHGEWTSSPRAVMAGEGGTAILSKIADESRAQRDAVMAKVMADPRRKEAVANPPFDTRRMIFGGFTTLLSA